jgi:hypothetical protein
VTTLSEATPIIILAILFGASGISPDNYRDGLFDYLMSYPPLAGRFFLEMGLHQELPVYKAIYDLLLEIFSFTAEFSKEYKYTIGESLKKETIELLTLIFRANSRTDKHQVLQEARERIEVIRLVVRVMKDLHQISLKRFVHVSQKAEDVSKQLTGWQKSIKD